MTMNEPYTDFTIGRTYILDAPFPKEMMPDIEQFFANVHPSLAKGQDIYPEVFNSNLFFPLQRKRELEKMVRIARSISPKTVMEIGADKGGGLYHWCQCLPSVQRIIGCEIRGTPYSELFAANFPDIEFLWTRDSRGVDSLQQVSKCLSGGRIDVLFIDGDKSAFLQDFNAYLPLMSENGIVFMHDVVDSPPRQAFEMIVRSKLYRTEVIHDISEVIEAKSDRPHDRWLKHWNGRSCGVGVIYLGV